MTPSAKCLWLAGILPFATLGGASESPWQAQPPMPLGLAGFALVALDGRLHVAGGTAWAAEQKSTVNHHWSLQPGDQAWIEQTPLPRAFAYGAHGAYQHDLIVAAGTTGPATLGEVRLISAKGIPSVLGTLSRPTAYCGSTVAGSRLYVIGGTTNIDDLKQLRASFEVFDLATGRSELLPDYPGGAALHPRPLAIDGRILVFPGGKYNSPQARAINGSETWSYDVAKRHWSPRAPYPFAVRGLAVCALDGRRVLTAGGVRTHPDGETAMTGAAFVYDLAADRFHPLPPLPYAASLMETARIGEWIYVLGGEDRGRHRAREVYRARIADLVAALR